MLKRFVSIQGAGIFQDFRSAAELPQLRKFNLVYGHNGSGKSTLARILASLQQGSLDPRLPSETAFDIELEDGRRLRSPDDLKGIESRILVFNSDFVDANLQWSNGTARPVFYIGREQAGLAKQLATCEAALPALLNARASAAKAQTAAEKTLNVFKRERARAIANDLFLRGRKYEAPDLVKDFAAGGFDAASIRDDRQLDGLRALLRLEEPLPKLQPVSIDCATILAALERARSIASSSLKTVLLDEMIGHPTMAAWLKEGVDYHSSHELEKCLLCASDFTEERKMLLASALDDRFGRHLAEIDNAVEAVGSLAGEVTGLGQGLPSAQLISSDQRAAYESARVLLVDELRNGWRHLKGAHSTLKQKALSPSQVASTDQMPDEASALAWSQVVERTVSAINQAVDRHNATADEFETRQKGARDEIKRHYLAESSEEFIGLQTAFDASKELLVNARNNADGGAAEILLLKQQIQEHGQAAGKINQLISSYLGHSELAIVAVDDGYEIHRHEKAIVGLPSEGEKTAIALCYFISTLEVEGRRERDLIVVIDDPISSLDTKALNFACSLIKSRLNGVSQLVVLTHNQQCMNEFKKAWKGRIETRDGRDPTASLFFLDVYIPAGDNKRSSRIVQMSRFLREYESEYHFLFNRLLEFSKDGDRSEYAYMMPNVLRRILDVFLAFKCPGNSGLPGKMLEIAAEGFDLDADRLAALERLSQIESHSDNLDDLIGFSSMTLEETRDASAALLSMIEIVDPVHFRKISHICR